ncbi:MAG: hypothetical protein KDB80_17730, partial [Planctomycetes bacterium]|nr:hypothetical protein [Planctomycetota bacterium]
MSEHGDASIANDHGDPRPQTSATPGVRSGRKVWRILGLLAIGIAVLVAALPTIVSSTFLTSSVESNFRTAFGSDVKVERVWVGWFSGLEVAGLVVSNPSGFPQDEPALELGSLTGDISITSLLGGRLDVKGDVRGLKVHLIQHEDGTMNLVPPSDETTPVDVSDSKTGGHDSTRERGELDLGSMRLALTVEDSEVRVTQEPIGTIEHVRGIKAAIRKPFGTNDFVVEFDAAIGEVNAPGHVAALLDVDAAFQRPAKASLELSKVDLARYAPLLKAMMPDQVQEFAGVAGGKVEATIDPDVEVVVN